MLIAVPFVPQASVTANRFAYDCSLACLAMLLGWAKLKPTTVDSLALESSLRTHGLGLGAEEVAMLATAHGLPMYVRRGADVATLRYVLDHGYPCIVAVNAWKLGRAAVGDGAHDIVLVGYSKDAFTYHDPAARANIPISSAALANAMADRGDTAILVTAPDAPPVTRPAARVGTTTAKLNVREKPSTASRIITTLKKETRIPVIEDAPGWLRIAEGNVYAGRFVAAAWVSF